MQLKKVIALFLCLLLCMQVLTGSVFATDANVKSHYIIECAILQMHNSKNR